MNQKKVFLFATSLQLGFSMLCFGQAWIPPKGMAAISMNYQILQVDNHINGSGVRGDAGHIISNNVIADFSYSLTNKLALSVNIPFVTSKYNGLFPHQIPKEGGGFTIPLDDGDYHSTFQDFIFQVRYNVADNPLQLTPFVRATIPSHDYEFFAHSAPGIGTKRIQFGTYAGRVLDPIIPNAYIEGRYGYTFTPNFLDISTNYSSADLTLGYFISPSVRVFGFATGQYTHGGLDIQKIAPKVVTNPYFLHHDQLTRTNYLNLGGGGSYTINDSIDVYGAISNTVSGRNTHAVRYGITFGMSYGFQGFRPPDSGNRVSNSRDSKAVCLCAVKEGSN